MAVKKKADVPRKAIPRVRAYRLPQGLQAEDMFPDWQDMGATIQEVYFSVEYLTNGFDAQKAYAALFPAETPRKAAFGGNSYLRRPTVQRLLSAYTAAWLRGRVAYLEKEVLDTTMARAFYDPAKFLNPDGTPAFDSWDDIPPVYRRCIEGIDVKFWGKDASRQSVTYTLANRAEAMQQLTKLLGLIKEGMGDSSRESQMTPDTEMLLSSIFSQGRQVDRRPPAQRRAIVVESPAGTHEEPVITGLG